MAQVPDEWSILSMLEWGTKYLEEKGIPSPRLSMEWLLADILEIRRLDLYLKYDRPLSRPELTRLKPLLMRRAEHEPLQYIVGYTDFMNVRIDVSPSVLIPRPETEQLVEIILEKHGADTPLKVVDAGTGSGCIPVALKKERPAWQVFGFDISTEALEIARENATLNEVDVTFFEADLTDIKSLETRFSGNVDLIVSNPPYIRPDEIEKLEPEVKDYEPSLALFHPDPAVLYEQLILNAGLLLNPGGKLYLEIHEEYGNQILPLFKKGKWTVRLLNDYNKKNRFITAEIHF